MRNIETTINNKKNKQVKFCGFTRRSDIMSAISMGVDAIGLVFYPASPRYVSPQKAFEITKGLSAFTSIVALVVNTTKEELQDLSQTLPFDVIQFHGDETADECHTLAALINKRWIKALRINSETDSQESLIQKIARFEQAGASGIILDAYHQNFYGGTGERFDWSLIPTDCNISIILAGGLTPENVKLTRDIAINGVDVSGGIELVKGVKDSTKMQNFLNNIV